MKLVLPGPAGAEREHVPKKCLEQWREPAQHPPGSAPCEGRLQNLPPARARIDTGRCSVPAPPPGPAVRPSSLGFHLLQAATANSRKLIGVPRPRGAFLRFFFFGDV